MSDVDMMHSKLGSKLQKKKSHLTALRPINLVMLSLTKMISPAGLRTRRKPSRQGRMSILGKDSPVEGGTEYKEK